MSVKLSKTLKGKRGASSAAPTIHEYEERFRNAKRGGLEKNWRRGKATTRSSTISIMTWLRIPISTDGANPFTLHLASPERASRHRLLAMSALGPGTRIQTGDGRRRPRLWCRRVVIGDYPFFRRQNRRRKQQWLLAGRQRLWLFERPEIYGRGGADASGRVPPLRLPARRCSERLVRRSLRHRGNLLCNGQLSVYGEVFRLLKPGGCFGAY